MMLEKKQKSVTQVKLEANERGVEMILVNYCDCLKNVTLKDTIK
jgi:hypothetical protein